MNKKFISKLQKLPLVKKASLVVLIFSVAFIIPRINFGLKVLGFVEKDFIKSTSGAIFETNKESFFKARVGNSSDNAKTQLYLEIEGHNFELSLLPSLTATSSFSLKESTPSSPIQIATSSPELKLDDINNPQSSVSASISGLLKEINDQIASVSSGLSEISKEIKKIRDKVIDTIGGTEQTFVGPYEAIKHKGEFLGEVIYYVDKHTLIESWSFNELQDFNIPFALSSDNLNLTISTMQKWEFFDGSKKILAIESELYGKNNEKISLPEVEEQKISGNQTKGPVILKIPEEIITEQKDIFPIKIIRRYNMANDEENSPKSKLIRLFGEETTAQSAIIGPSPRFITRASDYILAYDNIDKNLQVVTRNENAGTIFSDIEATGLSCGEEKCLLAVSDNLIVFDPLTLLEALPTTDRETLIQKIGLADNPIGGVAQAGKTIFRTSNVSPNGTLYKLENLEKEEEKVTSNLPNAQLLSVNKKGERFALLADGQLQIGAVNSKPKIINLPEQPESLSFGPDNFLYAVIPYEKTNTKMIIRIAPDTNKFEILSNFDGEFISIFADGQGLVIGLNLDSKTGAVVSLPWEKLSWHILNESEYD